LSKASEGMARVRLFDGGCEQSQRTMKLTNL